MGQEFTFDSHLERLPELQFFGWGHREVSQRQ
jgi:hypothetical protein